MHEWELFSKALVSAEFQVKTLHGCNFERFYQTTYTGALMWKSECWKIIQSSSCIWFRMLTEVCREALKRGGGFIWRSKRLHDGFSFEQLFIVWTALQREYNKSLQLNVFIIWSALIKEHSDALVAFSREELRTIRKRWSFTLCWRLKIE